MMKHNKGFSLVELLVVVACLAALACVAAPNWIQSQWPRYQLKGAVRQMANDLRYARARSVSTNREYRMMFDATLGSYVLESGDQSSGSRQWTATRAPTCFGPAGQGVFSNIRLVSVSTDRIVFKPTGNMTPTRMTLENTIGGTLQVVCAMSGRIRITR
ncbi:MAG: GspH/FimT family protein [Deltaproteobacteria bacterium]|nr:GspH/FimT family protein [Deltaproteobacteria bacterium]